jgi:hypothetical protein
VQPVFTRDDLAEVEILGERVRLVGTQTGIWKPRQLSSALSISRVTTPMTARGRMQMSSDQTVSFATSGGERIHIKSDAEGGSAAICNGLALCKIHHGAFDANMLGITPDYRVRIKESVLDTFDGPTLQHALKEIDGAQLAQIPTRTVERPDRGLLDERYQRFLRHANWTPRAGRVVMQRRVDAGACRRGVGSPTSRSVGGALGTLACSSRCCGDRT